MQFGVGSGEMVRGTVPLAWVSCKTRKEKKRNKIVWGVVVDLLWRSCDSRLTATLMVHA